MQWEQLTAPEFAAAVRETGVCVIAMGVVERRVASEKSSAAFKAELAASKKARETEMAAKLKVGSLLSYSWGYEQTNVEFFEVTAKKGKTVTLRKIAGEREGAAVSGSLHWRAVHEAHLGLRRVVRSRQRLPDDSGIGTLLLMVRMSEERDHVLHCDAGRFGRPVSRLRGA